MGVKTLKDYLDGNSETPVGKIFGNEDSSYTLLNLWSDMRTRHIVGEFEVQWDDYYPETEVMDLAICEELCGFQELIEGVNAVRVKSLTAQKLMEMYPMKTD